MTVECVQFIQFIKIKLNYVHSYTYIHTHIHTYSHTCIHAQTGDVVTTPGPDVATSCGNRSRVLTLDEEYVVGIGASACNPISDWTTLESYSESEVELLESLQQQSAEDPSTYNGASGSHLIDLLLPLVAVTALLTH